MSSVREIAMQVGVSPATVSRVMNNDPGVSERLRERVLSVANKTRYVARVGKRSTTNIGFVFTGNLSLGSPFDSAMMAGMGDCMDRYGYDLIILDASRSLMPGESYSQMFMRKGIRGAVLRTTQDSRRIAEGIAEEEFPMVVVGDHFESSRASFVYCDSRDTSRDAVSHLIGLGHRKIAVASNVVDDEDHSDRVAGYRSAMLTAGLPIDPRYVMRAPARLDGGVQLMRQIRTMKDPPTAIYVTDPMTTVGLMNEAAANGVSIPRDFSVVGFDDGDMRYMCHPTLTAVCQDTQAIGREAFEVLYSIIDQAGQIPQIKKALRTTFEIHGSTGPCP